jgi:hypothetical protein
MNAVDPLAGEIGERGEIRFGGQPSRLKPTHLARRRRAAMGCLAADDPAHRRIMAKTFGVVDVLVSGEAAEHGLPQHADRSCRCGVGQSFSGHRANAERVVEFAIGE